MADFDLIVKDGMIFDGARNPRYRADIGISDGFIRAIGALDPAQARRTLDASGLHVAPGFIDLHTHYDAQIFWDPYLTLSGWHGITSVVIGNCGFGFAPVAPEGRERAMRTMTRNEAIPLRTMQEGMPWDWVSFPEYLDSVERTPKALNLLPYFPVSPMLVWVLGLEAAKAGELPSDAQHAEMRRLLNEAMDAGACGWSAQRLHPSSGSNPQRDADGTPMVSDVMRDETCLELARVLRERNEGFMQTILSTGDPQADRAFTEKLAEISRRPVIHSGIAAKPGGYHRMAIEWLRSCRERGLRVYGQGITTSAGATFDFRDFNLWDDSDAWREVCLGTPEERKAKLADPARRQALKDDPPSPSITSAVEDVVVSLVQSEELKGYEQMRLGDLAEQTGRHPVDLICDIAVADDLRSEFYMEAFDGPPEYHRELAECEYMLPGISDGGAHTRFLTAGRYPTEYLSRYVRDRAWLGLEEAHWRLSGLPAFCAGFKDRGVIREGVPADIVVYDYPNLEALEERKAWDLPGGEWRRIQRARGYRYVIVNGQVTIEDDQETGTHSGLLLRHGTGKPAPRAR